MQEKSKTQAKQWEAPLDRLADFLWKQCDVVVGIGIAILIMTLFICTFCIA